MSSTRTTTSPTHQNPLFGPAPVRDAGPPRDDGALRGRAPDLGVVAKDLWTAVAFISIATACHQAWSANMFTVASDAFPSLVYASREVRLGAARSAA